MTDPQVPVPAQVQTGVVLVQTKAKAFAATVTTVLGVLALLVTQVSDGSYSAAELSTLIGAVVTAAATIAAVWRVPNNEAKPAA